MVTCHRRWRRSNGGATLTLVAVALVFAGCSRSTPHPTSSQQSSVTTVETVTTSSGSSAALVTPGSQPTTTKPTTSTIGPHATSPSTTTKVSTATTAASATKTTTTTAAAGSPSVSVNPDTNLVSGQSVQVTGQHFAGNKTYAIVECVLVGSSTSENDCDTDNLESASANSQGTVTTSLQVTAGPFGSGGVSCAASTPCVVAVSQFSLDPSQEAYAPISFKS